MVLTKQEKKKYGGYAMILGIFILFSLFNFFANEGTLSYDGELNDFKLIIKEHSQKAEVGDLYSVDLKVINQGENGTMYVQCSILDKNDHPWLSSKSGIGYLTENENCVANEPFTQTAIIQLDKEEVGMARFSFTVPNNIGGDNIIFCEAFEQCSNNNQASFASSSVTEEISIIEDDGNIQNNNFMRQAGICEQTSDCSGWLIGQSSCVNGMCVDKEDAAISTVDESNKEGAGVSISVSDETIKTWASTHKVLSFGIGFILLIIGAIFAYSSPKEF